MAVVTHLVWQTATLERIGRVRDFRGTRVGSVIVPGVLQVL